MSFMRIVEHMITRSGEGGRTGSHATRWWRQISQPRGSPYSMLRMSPASRRSNTNNRPPTFAENWFRRPVIRRGGGRVLSSLPSSLARAASWVLQNRRPTSRVRRAACWVSSDLCNEACVMVVLLRMLRSAVCFLAAAQSLIVSLQA